MDRRSGGSIVIWLPLAGTIITAALLRALWERRTLSVTRKRVTILPSSGKEIQAEMSDPDLRIAHLSDLHAEHFFIRTERLIDEIRRSQPDVIVFTGDLSGPSSATARGVAIITHLHRHPALKHIPFYAVGGNHDVPEALELLRHHGIRVLDNMNDFITVRQQPWQIIGLQDLRQGQPDLPLALSQPKIIPDFSDQHRIILAHNPDTLLRYPQSRAAIWLCGHLHGGQIWAPFRLEYLLLRQEQLPRRGITRGLHRIGGQPLYISRGLGCVAIPLRLFSLPELVILDLIISPQEEKESVRE